MRSILMVMVTVVASMTLHHGAMAAGPAAHGHAQSHIEHEVDGDLCTQECPASSHSIPACCGMGLCLSGLPVNMREEQYLPRRNAQEVLDWGLQRWSLIERLDRPPKNSGRDEL